MFDIGQECCSLVKGGGRVFEVQVEEVEEAITFAKWETSRSCWRAWCLQFLGYKTLKEDSFELKDLKWELNIARTGPLTVHSLCAHFWAPQNSKRFKQKVDPSFLRIGYWSVTSSGSSWILKDLF